MAGDEILWLNQLSDDLRTNSMVKKGNNWEEWLDRVAAKTKVWAGAVVAAALVLYGQSIPLERIGWGLSDELMVAGASQGVARSPGYPLLSLGIYLTNQLRPAGMSLPFAGGVLSAVMAAVALGLMFLSLVDLHRVVAREEKRKFVLVSERFEGLILALAGVGMLGFSGYFWSFAQVVERYALSMLLVAGMIYALVSFTVSQERKRQVFWARIGALILGLGISHEWYFWLFLPVWSYLLGKNLKSELANYLLWVLILVLAAVVPFGWLWRANGNEAWFSYQFEPSLNGLVNFVGQNYWGEELGRARDLVQLLKETRLDVMLKVFGVISQRVMDNFSWWAGLPLLMAGLYQYSSRKKPELWWVVVGLAGGLVIGLSWGLKLTNSKFELALLSPQLMGLYQVLILVMWFGWWELIKRVGQAGAILQQREKVSVMLIGLLILPSVWLGKERLEKTNLRKANVARQVYRQMLTQADERAIMVCFQVSSCSGLAYEQMVNGVRRDVLVLPSYMIGEKVRLAENDLELLEYEAPIRRLFDLVTYNLERRRIYVVDMTDEFYQWLGIDLGFVNYIPRGYMGELSKGLPDELPVYNYPVSEKLIALPKEKWNLMQAAIEAGFARRHILNGRVYMKTGMREAAYKEANLVANLFFGLAGEDRENLNQVREGIERLSESKHYEPGMRTADVNEVMAEVDRLSQMKAKTRAVEVARGAVIIDPENVAARMKWADLLAELGASEAAAIEYKNVLRLDRDNTEAKSKLELVESFLSN